MGIGKDLRQLKFTHLPMMDLITTALHGFLTNAYFMMAGMKSERWIENALAMMLGDFVGSFFILMLLWFGLSVFRKNDKN
jgi:formate/nitrite transporter FocA (FNT family)